jgi:hypothetical protein
MSIQISGVYTPKYGAYKGVMCNLMTTLNHFYKYYKPIIPIVVLTVIGVLTILTYFTGTDVISGTEDSFILTAKHYAAFLSLVINYASFFTVRQHYKYILSLTFLFGLVNLINFTPALTISGLRIGQLEIGFQPTIFLTVILTYFLYFKRLNNYILDLFTLTTDQNEKMVLEQIEKFKYTYKNKDTEELIQIISENKYVPEALEAARQLLNERSSTQ